MSEILFTMRDRRRRGPRRRRRTTGRGLRLARLLAWGLVVLGVLGVADVAVTLLWREPVTALIATLREGGLESQLRQVESAPPSHGEREALARLSAERRRVRYLARRLEGDAAYGSAVGRIAIPRIHIDYVMVKGTGESELELGPGIYSKSLYPTTSFPGAGTITAIAGHRTTWLEPFRRINELHRGERIFVTMPYGRFTYIVTRQRIVPEADVEAAIAPTGSAHIVLSACYPLFSAEKRILIFARLLSVQPRGAAVIHPRRSGAFGQRLLPASALEEGAERVGAGRTGSGRSGSERGSARPGAGPTSGARSPGSAPRLPRS